LSQHELVIITNPLMFILMTYYSSAASTSSSDIILDFTIDSYLH